MHNLVIPMKMGIPSFQVLIDSQIPRTVYLFSEKKVLICMLSLEYVPGILRCVFLHPHQ
jgi:hypothetical protein